MKTSDVIIIGGGVAGLAVAKELAQRKAGTVTVLEKNYVGSGNTTRNVTRIRRMQLNETLTELALVCNRKYDEIADILGFNVLFRRGGYAWLLYDEDEVSVMREMSNMHHRFGVKSELLGQAETLRLLPFLKDGEPIKGALFDNSAATVHHDAVVIAYTEWTKKLGVKILQQCEVKGIEIKDGRIIGVDTSEGTIATKTLINAAGPYSSFVSKLAGVNIPTKPLRREVMVTVPVKPLTDIAITFYRPVEGWFNQTMRGEIIAGVVATDEPFGLNMKTSFDFLTRTCSVLVRKAPILGNLRIQRCWAGAYDISPDHLALVGQSNEVQGFFQLNGWSGRGMWMSPYIAELLAVEILTGKRHVLLKPFDANRFKAQSEEDHFSSDYYARYRNKQ